MTHRRFALAMLKFAGMMVLWLVCWEWMSVFAKGEYAEEVHTGNRVQTYWRSRKETNHG